MLQPSCVSESHEEICKIPISWNPPKWSSESVYRVGARVFVCSANTLVVTKVFFLKFLKFNLFWLHCVACGILVPWPRIKPGPSTGRTQSPNHWITRNHHLIFHSFKHASDQHLLGIYPVSVTVLSMWYRQEQKDKSPSLKQLAFYLVNQACKYVNKYVNTLGTESDKHLKNILS